MEFRDRLKALREKKGISQAALAKAIYVSRSAVAKWENGLGIPSDENLQALCDYFGVEEDWILDRHDLKQQITFGKRQAAILVVALLGIMTVILYVVLGFSLKFHWVWGVTSMYYPTVSLFGFVLDGYSFVLDAATKTGTFALLFGSAVTVWAVHVLFALSSVVISVFKKHFRMCLWGNIGFILLSAGMFLLFFFLTVQAAAPIYEL